MIVDPTGHIGGEKKVKKGGSWNSGSDKIRAATRNWWDPVTKRGDNIGFRLALRDENKAPTDLNATSTLAVSENLPLGTSVGEFNATDPNGDPLVYSLLSGNDLFTIEQNGTLKTNAVFDYEEQSSHTITVKVEDDKGLFITQDFQVSVTDEDDLGYSRSSLASSLQSLSDASEQIVLITPAPGNDNLVLSQALIISASDYPNLKTLVFYSPGDLFVTQPVSIAGVREVILRAGGDVYIGEPVSMTSTDGNLTMEYGYNAEASGNSNEYYLKAPINLQAGATFRTKQGWNGGYANYNVITELGADGSTTGSDLQGIAGTLDGNFALGQTLMLRSP